MWLLHELAAYWRWAGSNVGAMPACSIVAAVFGILGRNWIGRRLAKWWDKHHGPHAVNRHLEALQAHHEAGEKES